MTDARSQTQARRSVVFADVSTVPWLSLASIVVVATLALGLFFWPVWNSQLGLVPGDIGDARYINFILEHWLEVAKGHHKWLSPPMFYPEEGTLGYGDAFFLLVPPYVAARSLGLSLPASYTIAIATMVLAGYFSCIWLFRRVLQVPLAVAIAGALLFAFSNMHVLHVGHAQLYTVAMVPLLAGLAIRYVQEIFAGRPGLRFGIPSALLLAGVFYTSFYIGWYFVFLALVVTLIAILAGLVCRARELRVAVMKVRRATGSMATVLVTLAIGLIPFFITYLPVLRQFGGRSWADVRNLLPRASNFFDVGATNLAWGWASPRFVAADSPWPLELKFGIPYLLALTFAITMVILLRRVVSRTRAYQDEQIRQFAALCVGAGVVACSLLMLRVGDISLWSVVHLAVPGARSMRAIFRFQFVLQLAAIAVVVYGLALAWHAPIRGIRLRAPIGVLLVLLLFEQVNTGMTYFDGRADMERLGRTQPVPPYCRRFVLAAEKQPNPHGAPIVSIDAVLVAVISGIPTLNGYSGLVPPSWNLFDPTAPGYSLLAAEWARNRHVVDGICELDLATGSWRRVAPSAGNLLNVNLVRWRPATMSEALGVGLSGFYGEEVIGRWTSGDGIVRFTQPVAGTELVVGVKQWNPVGGNIRIGVNGRTVFDDAVSTPTFTQTFSLSEPVREISIDSRTFVPQSVDARSRDARKLGVVVDRIEIR